MRLTSRVPRHSNTLNHFLNFRAMIRPEFAIKKALRHLIVFHASSLIYQCKHGRRASRIEQKNTKENDWQTTSSFITLNTYQRKCSSTKTFKCYHQHESSSNRSSTIEQFYISLKGSAGLFTKQTVAPNNKTLCLCLHR